MTKIISAMLLIVIFAGTLAACSSGPEEIVPIQTPEPEEVYQDTGYGQGNTSREQMQAELEDILSQIQQHEEEPGTYNFGTPITFPGVANIDFAGEEDMAMHPGAPRVAWIEEGIWMMFSFEQPVRDVVLVGVAPGFDEAYEFWLYEVGKLIYEAGDLAPGQPFFVQTFGHFGTLPAQAIGFTYADGIRYYIPFDQSQMDGSLVLHKWAAFTFDS